jgi:sigma-B regulation protein RsbU (phosphoserine phosphatase)
MHRILQRQLKRTLGLSDEAAFGNLLDAAGVLARQTDIDPAVACLLGNFGELLKRVETAYEQSDRDLELRARSLELSSGELSEANNQLQQDMAKRSLALHSMHQSLAQLLSNQQKEDGLAEAHVLNTSDDELGAVAQLIGSLVRDGEAARRALHNQQFALDQHGIVSITGGDGRITYANRKFTEISGYTVDELVGRNHRLIKSGLHTPEFYHQMWETIKAGKVWHGEICNRSKLGELYWVAATIVPWLDELGRPYQYISIRTDITCQKKIELALEQARLNELETAHQIQLSLLFGDIPQGIVGADIATYTEPSQGIDGDFYAVHRFSAGCFDILVGDVMGKGVPAALIGAAIKTNYNMVLAELLSDQLGQSELPSPADIVNLLHRNLTHRLIGLSSFATLALYRFDLSAGKLTLVNAGHTPGLLLRGSSGEVESILGSNIPIGIADNEIYEQSTVAIRPGDRLLAYSDGITECCNSEGEEFGLDRLLHLVQAAHQKNMPPAALLQSMRHQLQTFSGSKLLRDDQTALSVELCTEQAGDGLAGAHRCQHSLSLPWRIDALSELREAIRELAVEAPEIEVAALTLAAFEVATNAIRHAPQSLTDATITCKLRCMNDQLSVELIYPSVTAFEPPASPEPDFSGQVEGGFGLFIIHNSVDQVQYTGPLPGISSVRLIKQLSPP